MASAYQPTTVRNEDRDDHGGNGSCNPFHGRRHHDLENARQQQREQNDGDRQERVNQW